MYFLGIDPGLSEVGFGVVRLQDKALDFVDAGIIKTSPGISLAERLSMIKEDLDEILFARTYAAVGVEELFFVKNITSGIKVAHARGVILQELAAKGLPILEMKPSEIKNNLCGSGSADKKQIQEMVRQLLHLSSVPRPHDAADALAIAILTSRLHKG